MASSDPLFDRKLAAIFRAEAAEHVQRMEECLEELRGAATGAAGKPLEGLFRAAHSLKGAARAVGEDEVEAVCHAAEGLLAGLQQGRLGWSDAMSAALQEAVSALHGAVTAARVSPGALVTLVPQLERLERGEAVLEGKRPAPTRAPSAPEASDAEATAAVAREPRDTLRVPVEVMESLLHQVEELATSRAQAGLQLHRLDETLASARVLRSHCSDGDAAAARQWQHHADGLQAMRKEAWRERRQLASALDTLLRDLKKTLLLPAASSLGPFLAAAARELARSQQKDVDLRLRAEEVQMDRRMLEQLREPLLHLLRNAIGHGLEEPRDRSAAGKPAQGIVEVGIVARAGGRVEIRVHDDGAGIDVERLAAAARQAGVAVADDASRTELLSLVFGHGVSTAERLTTVAGRGIGLAIVRERVEAMGGAITVDSEPRQGTTFTIALTTSLATYRAIEVAAAGRSFLLPTARVERVLRIAAASLRNVGSHQAVPVRDEDLPLARLAAVLELPSPPAAPAWLHCLVLSADTGRRVALAVDEIRGEQEVRGKPVAGAVTGTAMTAGAAMLDNGRLVPMLNASEVVRAAFGDGVRRAPAPAAVALRPAGSSVLLAEDSITSRTLLKNILELAGHRVDVAVDGHDALAKLRAGRYDIVVSDVEMPRLDGIGLTQAIRKDPALAHLPVVLVTSLGSPADRERGAEAGANAYIVKSSFDQGNLLQVVSELA